MCTRLGLLSFLLSIGLATPAAAFCRLTTESPSASQGLQTTCYTNGIELAWKQQCISYTLVPHDELIPLGLHAVRDTVERSFGSWMALRCSDEDQPIFLGQTVELGSCSYAEYNRFGPNANTVAFARDWESRGNDFVPEAYALTLVWHNPETGEIIDADIQVNLNHGPIAICEEACEPNQVDLQNVLTHEVGHFLGLAHSDKKEAAMYGEARMGEVSKRLLQVDDAAGMCDAYGTLESPDCDPADFAPRRGFSPYCGQSPESTTCVVSRGPVLGTDSGRIGPLAPCLGVLALLALYRGRCRVSRRWRT